MNIESLVNWIICID